ncbi:MAG: membrane protein insertion efficiency factor YidD [Cytophagales bacterium]|nr:membrane protein insertion efficiency factor YidD [Cytophagales bacterium]
MRFPKVKYKKILNACKLVFRSIVILPIVAYQYLVSPMLPMCCRFQPTCSAYIKEAIMKRGIVKGGWLGIKRIIQCHPWGRSGYHPID